jgi:hypothetical protein
MKKQYSAPTLSNYGAVTELTQLTGSGPSSDFWILNDTLLNGSQSFYETRDGYWGSNPKK